MSHTQDWITSYEGGLRLTIKAKPATSRARDVRVVDVGDGKTALEIAVAAAPQDGKANTAILAEVAALLKVKKSDVTLKTGQTSRLKVVEVTGSVEALLAQLSSHGLR